MIPHSDLSLYNPAIQEFSWSGSRRFVSQEFLDFAARNTHTIKSEMTPASPGQIPESHARAYSVEDFTLVHGMGTGENGRLCVEIRDEAGIAADGKDRFVFMIQSCGERVVNQLGRTQRVVQGSSVFYCTSEPYVIETSCPTDKSEMIALYIPSQFVHQRVSDGRRWCLRTSSKRIDLNKFVTDTFKSFAKQAWKFTPHEFYHSARSLSEIILIGFDGSQNALSENATTRSTQILRVKNIVRQQMGNPELRISDVAEAAGLSLNYVHNLFRDENQTLYEFLKGERLRRARELLHVAASRGLSITDVSVRCGFSDSSYFSRVFKQAFGVTPRTVFLRR